jgi:hypothetical protein
MDEEVICLLRLAAEGSEALAGVGVVGPHANQIMLTDSD